jgi:DNA mismatch repair protein MutS
MNQMTPMLKQYLGIKNEYPDAILFFRMGDFYEMFFEDAEIASRILGITLTSRGTYHGEKVPMCGVPHHASQSYVTRLVENGRKVAICEQIEDPKESKGIVKREVVRVATPGSLVDDSELESKSNLHMASLHGKEGAFGLAHLDLSTGEFRVTETRDWAKVLDELGRIAPAELLIAENSECDGTGKLSSYRLEVLSKDSFDERTAADLLKAQLGVRSLEGFGCAGMDLGIIAAGAVAHYLGVTQKGSPDHVKNLVTYHLTDFMFLDEATVLNLELFRTLRRQSTRGSLFQIIDRTVTPMGGRLLKRWMAYPLLDLREIRRRLGAVAFFRDNPILREEVRNSLKGIYDLERLNGRVSLGRANARDLVALSASIRRIPEVRERLAGSTSELLGELTANLDPLEDIARLIEQAICDEPPVSLREGGIIEEGYDEELDRLISALRDGKEWIAALAISEQQRTGIPNLKIGYNRVFGYYLEVSKSNMHLVPADYIRKQTLVNGERYITEELKGYEELVVGAQEKRVALEFEIFEHIRKTIALENRRILKTGSLLAAIDVLGALAETAERNGYIHPSVDDNGVIDIVDGRHPVIEQSVKDEAFVPNDIFLDDKEQQVLILTGPNMAGKSTILRQTGLTVLMAQMGSFVPASKARIGLVDRIFTRIGASDDLAAGQSTFMVEMNETANILRHATCRSLVILDEIGRGTSTYDGLSIAWAVAEALHDREDRGVKTLFATHYHELTELVTTKRRVKNFNIAVRKWNDQIIFLRKLVPGGTSRSYGIEVARIAGLPEEVIDRAGEILENLEREDVDEAGRPRLAHSLNNDRSGDIVQLSLFGMQDQRLNHWIRNLDLSSITPLEALLELNKMKEYVGRLERK